MIDILTVGISFLLAMAILSSYRLFVGPTHQDRLIAINMVSLLVVLSLVLYSIQSGVETLVDIAIAFFLLDFVGTIAYTKFLGGERA